MKNMAFKSTATFFALVVLSWATPFAYGQTQPTGIMHRRDVSLPSTSIPVGTTDQGNMVYHGGLVLPNTTTYAIWWGNPGDFPPDMIAGVDLFLSTLNGSSYLATADQYMFGAKTTTRFGGNLFNNSPPPSQLNNNSPRVFDQNLGDGMCAFMKSNNVQIDPNAIYLFFTSNYPGGFPACAFHFEAACKNYMPAQFWHGVYAPNMTSLIGCSVDPEPYLEAPYVSPNNYSSGTRAAMNLVAHEVMEAITDPNVGDGWWNPNSGNEVGDGCIFVFHDSVSLTSSNWQLQEIWSNQASGCAQGDGATVQLLGAVSQKAHVTSFDISGATYGIFGAQINSSGTVAGTYYDNLLPVASLSLEGTMTRGFLRDSSGNVLTFDAPGAISTAARGINATGTVAGAYLDAQAGEHGFLRSPQGTFTSFDVPTVQHGTGVKSINGAGTVVGAYVDAQFDTHGYVRDPLGNFTIFDAPGHPYETVPMSINDSGVVAGFYGNLNQPFHGFVRDVLGNITTFDVAGGVNGTMILSINGSRAVAGTFTDANFVKHGFVRDSYGTITTFDAPGARYGTVAQSVDNYGAVGGYFSDSNGVPHGFVRDEYGNFTVLSDIAKSVNDSGATTGYEVLPVKR